ncbi:MAG: tetratricopeptide repeat protein [Bacteroidales bacterium]|nr:tetratricopeptide repeat protein [Bacteroidales bacterium]
MATTKKTLAFLALLLILNHSLSAQKRIAQYEPEAIFNEAKMLFENKNYGSATELFHQYLEMAADHENRHTVEAEFYEAVGSAHIGEGHQLILDFVHENPASIWATKANLLYANILLENRKYRDAIKIYESINPDMLSDEERAEYNFKKAISFYQVNKVTEAAPLFHAAALEQSAYQDDAHYYYAHIQYLDKNYDEAKKYFKPIENSPKYKDVIQNYMLQMNFSGGDFSAVTDNAEEALAKADKSRKGELALMIAEAWYQQQNFAKALDYYDVARKNTKRAFPREVEFRIGFCKMKAADYDAAIGHFQNATRKNDDELGQFGSYYLAQCYIETHQEKFARNAFLSAYKSDFDHEMSEDALFNYAKLSFIPGVDPFNDAVAQLNDFLDKNPQSERAGEARLMIVHLLLNTKDYNKALAAIERYGKMDVEMEKIYAKLTYNIAVQSYSDKDYDNAITFFNKTIKSGGTSGNLRADATYWLADAYLQKKDIENAEKNLMAFIKMPAAERSEMFTLSYYNFGYIAFQKGDFADAAKEFAYFVNQGDVEKSYESDAWMRIGDCYFMSRDYNKAISAYENASKLDPQNADYAMFQTGMGYGAMGETNNKVNSMNILCENHKNSSFYDRALYEIGMTHLGNNDERSAITAFDRLVKERPRSSFARKGLMKIGMLYYNNDQYEQALTSLQKVVKDYPDTEEAREAINIIRSIFMETNRTQEFFEFAHDCGINTSVSEKDSLEFRTAEKFFQEGNYNEAFNAAKQYIEHNKKGAYLLKINYFALTSLEKTGRANETKPYLEYIISQPDNDYTDNSLLKLAKMEFDANDFSKANSYYARLLNITENQKIRTEALEKSMICEYKLNNYQKAIEAGNSLATMDLTQTQKNIMNYAVGMSMFQLKDYVPASSKLEACARNDKTEIGAEAAYYDVLASWNMKEIDKTESKVFFISDNFGNHNYLVAKSFLVLSDVYVAKGNSFQAKETLKSVIENYPDDQHKNEIVESAQLKLAEIEKNENKVY